jgi:hypothetical protein
MILKKMMKFIKIILFTSLLLNIFGCGLYKPVDARKTPTKASDRAQKNIEEGRSFKVFDSNRRAGGDFQFASSNGLWKASLDVIDFMPLSSVNYSGGMIITDWYSENNNPKKSIKISIRFLTNEVRSDALDIKIFNRTCNNSSFDCKFTDSSEVLVAELKKEILKKATIYNKEDKEKTKKKK